MKRKFDYIYTGDLRAAYYSLPVHMVCKMFDLTRYELYSLLKERHIQPKSKRIFVNFGKIIEPKFNKNIDALKAYNVDIRQILRDNAMKDMADGIDNEFIQKIDKIVGVADVAGNYVRQTLREVGFLRRILPPILPKLEFKMEERIGIAVGNPEGFARVVFE